MSEVFGGGIRENVLARKQVEDDCERKQSAVHWTQKRPTLRGAPEASSATTHRECGGRRRLKGAAATKRVFPAQGKDQKCRGQHEKQCSERRCGESCGLLT